MLNYAISHYHHRVYTGILSRVQVSNFFCGNHVKNLKGTSLVRHTNTFIGSSSSGVCELSRAHCYFSNNLNGFPSLKATAPLTASYIQSILITLQILCNSKSTVSDIHSSYDDQCQSTKSQQPIILESLHLPAQQILTEDKLSIRQNYWKTHKNQSHPSIEDPYLAKYNQNSTRRNKLPFIESCLFGIVNRHILTRSLAVENQQYTERHLHSTKTNFHPKNDTQHPTTISQKKTAPENQHNITTDQCCTTEKLPNISKSQPTMTDMDHPTAGCRHVKCPSIAHIGAAVSIADVQLMNDAREIFDRSVDSVLPHHFVRNKLQLSQNDTILKVEDEEFLLQKNVYVIGFGKAVIGMARAVEDCLGQHIVKGVISVPTGIQQAFKDEGKLDMLIEPGSRIVVMEGAAGNLPDEASHKAAIEIIKIAEEAKEADILIVLISGGGSALLPSPKPPVSLEDMLSLTRLMSRSGASIIQLNTVRKQIELLKGGGLAKLAQPARVIALILSDVIGDPLDFIAGGPTVKDTSTLEDSLCVLKELHILDAIPSSVSKLLNKEFTQNPDHETDTIDWSHTQNILVGSNKSACDAAYGRSAELGYLPYLLSTQVEGEAQDVGRMYINLANYVSLSFQGPAQRGVSTDLEHLLMSKYNIDSEKLTQLHKLAQEAVTSGKKGVCVVAGGETTVIVKGKGIGGRNQEMAVAAALELDSQALNSLEKVNDAKRLSTHTTVAFLAAGTDGIDGPNSAAGGVVTAGFRANAAASGLDVTEFLGRNDTYTLLSKVDHGLNHVITGQTGTNVMDIHVLLITRSS